MSDDVSSARDAVSRRDPSALAWSLVVGALWDVLFGLPALFAPSWLGAVVGIEVPPPIARIVGLLLLMMAAVYLVAARSPHANQAIVAVAIAGRGIGAVILGSAFLSSGIVVYAIAGGFDLMLTAVQAVCWRRQAASKARGVGCNHVTERR